MTTPALLTYRNVLEESHAELTAAIATRDGATIEQSADPLDAVQLASERELAIRSIDRKTLLLRDVRAALRRLKEGTYGSCVRCEESISTARLRALPWAALCVACQHEADTEQVSSAATNDPAG